MLRFFIPVTIKQTKFMLQFQLACLLLHFHEVKASFFYKKEKKREKNTKKNAYIYRYV